MSRAAAMTAAIQKHPPKKRGRPPLAARSLEDALQAVQRGTAPKRPRNEFERIARDAPPRGRRPSPLSATSMAADLAEHYMREGLTPAEAVRRACAESTPRADPSNVRKYLKRRNPMVRSTYKRGGVYLGFPVPLPKDLPLLYSVEDVSQDDE